MPLTLDPDRLLREFCALLLTAREQNPVMLIGIILAVTWLILLVRYPSRALPVSLAAAALLATLAGWVIWQQQLEARRLAQLEINLRYDPTGCPAAQPLALTLRNGSGAALQQLSWKVTAYAPQVSANLAESRYAEARYRGPDLLAPGAEWRDCLALPPLREGYRASTLAFRAEQLRGHFVN